VRRLTPSGTCSCTRVTHGGWGGAVRDARDDAAMRMKCSICISRNKSGGGGARGGGEGWVAHSDNHIVTRHPRGFDFKRHKVFLVVAQAAADNQLTDKRNKRHQKTCI
jgi:hypothetical protein